MASGSTTRIASIVRVCRLLAERGFVPATDGNVSVRATASSILITRAGLLKSEAKPTDIVAVRLDGTITKKGLRPSSEMPMHLALYRAAPEIGAIVHAHPPFATAFALSGTRLTPNILPEVILELGDIPLVRYAMPSTEELGALVSRHATTCNAALLANHGAVTWGATVEEAFRRLEKLEHAAQIEWYARSLGGVRQLTPDQVSLLRSHHPHAKRTEP